MFFSFFFLLIPILPLGSVRQARGDSRSYNLHKLRVAAFEGNASMMLRTWCGALSKKIYRRMIGDKSMNGRFVYYLITLIARRHFCIIELYDIMHRIEMIGNLMTHNARKTIIRFFKVCTLVIVTFFNLILRSIENR